MAVVIFRVVDAAAADAPNDVATASASTDHHNYVHDNLLDAGKQFALAAFMPWCGHCERLTEPQAPARASEWDRVVEKSPLSIVRVDESAYNRMTNAKEQCDLSRILSKSVRSFPFVALVKKDLQNNKINVFAYDGPYPMTAESILNFFKSSKSQPF
jgi:thiol-disulfide isomerase/thioredoxin